MTDKQLLNLMKNLNLFSLTSIIKKTEHWTTHTCKQSQGT